MTPQITVKALRCERCGHIWLPRTPISNNDKVRACAKCKSIVWDIPIRDKNKKKDMKKNNNNTSNNKRKVLTAASMLIAFMAITLTVAPSIHAGQMAFAAKEGSSSSDSGGSNKGGDSKGSMTSDKGSSSDSKGSNGDNLKNDDDHGPPSAPGNDLPGNNMGPTPKPKPTDDGFTNKDGPQPKNPIVPAPPHCFPGPCNTGDHRNFCMTHPGTCTDRITDPFHRFHNDVKVIQKTIVVHDRNNTPQTIIVNQNPQGTCFVTQTQIANSNDLLPRLLEQCISITIVRG